MRALNLPQPTLTAEWLIENLGAPELIVLDASLEKTISAGGRSGPRMRIPGARRFDLENRFSDPSSALPHTRPKPHAFDDGARALGINRDSQIVVYDKNGVYSSPRARWMFRAMGHDQVSVLDGGLQAWIEAGGSLEPDAETQRVPLGNFASETRPGFFSDIDSIDKAIRENNKLIVDARSTARYRGDEPEPRAGLRRGHIPGSINIPFMDVLNGPRLRSREDLESIFAKHRAHKRPMIVSCGSGVTACIVVLAAEIAGISDITIYDGSWSEWGAEDSGRPVERTEAP